MGIIDTVKNLKLREWINIGFFVVSLAMLIAGSVMLAVAISSIPPMPPNDDIPTTTPTSSFTPLVIFSTSLASGITWTDDYSNPSTNAFKSLSGNLEKNMSTAWVKCSINETCSSTSVVPISTQINAFTKNLNGVNFFTQFVFIDTTATTFFVSTALGNVGYPTNSFSTSTSQCLGLVPPDFKSTVSPSGSPTESQLTTTKPTQQGTICDASVTPLTNIFLVDVSDPIIGTLEDKLTKMSSFLKNAPMSTNLNQQNMWNNQEFRLVTYGGNEATPLGRARNQNSWNNLLGYLNSTIVNPTQADGHEMTNALRFVYNNYLPNPGVAGNIIIIGDGFDYNEAATAQPIASALKSNFYYSIGVILITTSQAMRNMVKPIASDFSHFYPIDSVDYLNNPTVQQIQAMWTCEAFYPTHAPPTSIPTVIPLITTTQTITSIATTPTSNPLLPPIVSCTLNILYLIDQSQTMILNGYTAAVEYAVKSAKSFANMNPQTTFAFIVYNQVVVSESEKYSDFISFSNNLRNVPQSLGNSDVTVGFTEALNFIRSKSKYSDDSTRSLLYFITDGNDFTGKISSVAGTTKSIRSELLTQIVGIDLVETTTSRSNVQNAIQFGVNDGFSKSVYVGVSEPNNILDDKLLNSTNYELQCKDSTNCYTGLTFVIETSQAEGESNVGIQIQTVKNILLHYSDVISPFKMSVSFVYFSSPDNMVPNQTGQSGILFEQVTNSSIAISLLNATNFLPLGAASDLDLGFKYTEDCLKSNYLQNSNLVIFFARGQYEQLSNCCPDPSVAAASVRQQAKIQGIVIGSYSSKTQLDALTGSSSIDANAIIENSMLNNTLSTDLASKNIASAILPIIDNFISNQHCSDIPNYISPPCEDPIDVLIMLHANDRTNWDRILNFTASQLIPDLLGDTGSDPLKQLTTSSPINFAIITYYYLDVVTHADFTFLRSKSEYAELVSDIPFQETKGTATLSLAYKKAVDIFNEGRQYASKNVIIITDTMDISDMEDAFSEHDALVQLVGGNTSALTIDTNIIPGADNQININALQLDSHNEYSLRQISNSLTRDTCIYSPKQNPTAAPTPPSPTLPGPIPIVKARNVWPDITILIDTSVSQTNPMNDMLFEKIRSFLDGLLLQYFVGEKGSKFTIATFDGETVDYSCKFEDIKNYYDLSSCRNEKLSFYKRSHEDYRNLANALSDIRENIYENSTSGYRALNPNFLILFTLGLSSEPFDNQLSTIQRTGVQTIAIGLSNNMTNQDLSNFAQATYMVSDWSSYYTGIDTNYDLEDRLFQTTTKKRLPTTSDFFANIVFVVDQSSGTWPDHSNIVNFVKNFVKPFFVNPSKTQISIVPFADDVIAPLTLSSSQEQVDQWLNDWESSSSAGSNAANIGNAIQFVANMLSTSSDRPSYVIYTVGATNVTGADLSKQLLKQWQLYVANYNFANEDSFTNLVFSKEYVFSVRSSFDLLDRVNPMNETLPNPIIALTTDIYETQEGVDRVTFPTSSIAADIIILLDETGLSDNEFANIKNFLVDFSKKFSIGPLSTQFALQTYNGRTIPHDGFHLFESTNIDTVTKRIQQLTLAKATENSTDADLAGAIEQELFFFLTEANGWRGDVTTYSIIFSHADSFYTRDTATAQTLKNVSLVFAVGMNGETPDYVKNLTNTGFYEYVANVSLLTISSPVSSDLLTTLNNDYKKYVYPEIYNIKDIVKADFVFLIDNALGTSYSDRVQKFLEDFIVNVGTFSNSGNDTKLAVVSYGNDVNTDWDLQSEMDVDSLKSRIDTFFIATSSGPSHLKSAIDSVILDEKNFGVSSDRPTYIIIIAGSPLIDPKIDVSTSKLLNTKFSTFFIQANSVNSTFSYVEQVLGTHLIADRIAIDSSLQWGSNSMDALSPWISNEFSAWLNTYPNS